MGLILKAQGATEELSAKTCVRLVCIGAESGGYEVSLEKPDHEGYRYGTMMLEGQVKARFKGNSIWSLIALFFLNQKSIQINDCIYLCCCFRPFKPFTLLKHIDHISHRTSLNLGLSEGFS